LPAPTYVLAPSGFELELELEELELELEELGLELGL
jgi:hypothetical protein